MRNRKLERVESLTRTIQLAGYGLVSVLGSLDSKTLKIIRGSAESAIKKTVKSRVRYYSKRLKKIISRADKMTSEGSHGYLELRDITHLARRAAKLLRLMQNPSLDELNKFPDCPTYNRYQWWIYRREDLICECLAFYRAALRSYRRLFLKAIEELADG